MGRRSLIALCALVALAVPGAAQAGSLKFELGVSGHLPQPATCPTGTPAGTTCQSIGGSAAARGLGTCKVQAAYSLGHRSSGGFDSSIAGTISCSKGSFSLAGDNSADSRGGLVYAVTLDGAGGFASASGSGELNFIGILSGTGRFIVDGNVSGGVDFDTVAPSVTVSGATAHALGHGRFAVTVRYKAGDAGGPMRASLTLAGSSKQLFAGAAGTTAHATVSAPGARRVVLVLTVTDGSANATTRRVVVALPH
jgi:hypothetical protein